MFKGIFHILTFLVLLRDFIDTKYEFYIKEDESGYLFKNQMIGM